MIQTRPDWCISRQRVWGVPIAVFLCESCGKPLNDRAINRKVVELFARAGADAWFTPESDTILPAGTKCPHCNGAKFEKETDIFDVWLESGASYLALIAAEPNTRGHPIFIWKVATNTADGSSRLCFARWARAPRLRIAGWSRPVGRSTKRSGDVEVARQRRRSGRYREPPWRRDRAPLDRVRRLPRRCGRSEALMQRVGDNYKKIRNTFRYI